MADAGSRVADIERRWSALAGERNFDQMCRTMQRLLDELDSKDSPQARLGGGSRSSSRAPPMGLVSRLAVPPWISAC